MKNKFKIISFLTVMIFFMLQATLYSFADYETEPLENCHLSPYLMISSEIIQLIFNQALIPVTELIRKDPLSIKLIDQNNGRLKNSTVTIETVSGAAVFFIKEIKGDNLIPIFYSSFSKVIYFQLFIKVKIARGTTLPL